MQKASKKTFIMGVFLVVGAGIVQGVEDSSSTTCEPGGVCISSSVDQASVFGFSSTSDLSPLGDLSRNDPPLVQILKGLERLERLLREDKDFESLITWSVCYPELQRALCYDLPLVFTEEVVSEFGSDKSSALYMAVRRGHVIDCGEQTIKDCSGIIRNLRVFLQYELYKVRSAIIENFLPEKEQPTLQISLWRVCQQRLFALFWLLKLALKSADHNASERVIYFIWEVRQEFVKFATNDQGFIHPNENSSYLFSRAFLQWKEFLQERFKEEQRNLFFSSEKHYDGKIRYYLLLLKASFLIPGEAGFFVVYPLNFPKSLEDRFLTKYKSLANRYTLGYEVEGFRRALGA